MAAGILCGKILRDLFAAGRRLRQHRLVIEREILMQVGLGELRLRGTFMLARLSLQNAADESDDWSQVQILSPLPIFPWSVDRGFVVSGVRLARVKHNQVESRRETSDRE